MRLSLLMNPMFLLRFELKASRLLNECSNQLSYKSHLLAKSSHHKITSTIKRDIRRPNESMFLLRVELKTSCLRNKCSNQLSYKSHLKKRMYQTLKRQPDIFILMRRINKQPISYYKINSNQIKSNIIVFKLYINP